MDSYTWEGIPLDKLTKKQLLLALKFALDVLYQIEKTQIDVDNLLETAKRSKRETFNGN